MKTRILFVFIVLLFGFYNMLLGQVDFKCNKYYVLSYTNCNFDVTLNGISYTSIYLWQWKINGVVVSNYPPPVDLPFTSPGIYNVTVDIFYDPNGFSTDTVPVEVAPASLQTINSPFFRVDNQLGNYYDSTCLFDIDVNDQFNHEEVYISIPLGYLTNQYGQTVVADILNSLIPNTTNNSIVSGNYVEKLALVYGDEDCQDLLPYEYTQNSVSAYKQKYEASISSNYAEGKNFWAWRTHKTDISNLNVQNYYNTWFNFPINIGGEDYQVFGFPGNNCAQDSLYDNYSLDSICCPGGSLNNSILTIYKMPQLCNPYFPGGLYKATEFYYANPVTHFCSPQSPSIIFSKIDNNTDYELDFKGLTVTPRCATIPTATANFIPVILYSKRTSSGWDLILKNISWDGTSDYSLGSINVLSNLAYNPYAKVVGSSKLNSGKYVTWVVWVGEDCNIYVWPFEHTSSNTPPSAIGSAQQVNYNINYTYDFYSCGGDFDVTADSQGRIWIMWSALPGGVWCRFARLDNNNKIIIFPEPFPQVLNPNNGKHSPIRIADQSGCGIRAISGMDPNLDPRVWFGYYTNAQLLVRYICNHNFPKGCNYPYTQPGTNCINPYYTSCGSIISDYNSIPGISSDKVPCMSTSSAIGHWLSVVLDQGKSLTITVNDQNNFKVGVGLYENCGISPVVSNCGNGYTSSTYINNTGRKISVLALVNYHQCADYTITINCN